MTEKQIARRKLYSAALEYATAWDLSSYVRTRKNEKRLRAAIKRLTRASARFAAECKAARRDLR